MHNQTKRTWMCLCAAGLSSAALFLTACTRQNGQEQTEQPSLNNNSGWNEETDEEQTVADEIEAEKTEQKAESERIWEKEEEDRESDTKNRDEGIVEKTQTAHQGVVETDVQDTDISAVELGDYRQFTYPLKQLTITDEEVDEEIAYLMAAEDPEPDFVREGTVGRGDIITMECEGKINGEQVEGLSGSDIEIIVGDGAYPVAFEDQLVGLEVGQTAQFSVTFPEDDPDVPGAEVAFTVLVTARADGYRRMQQSDQWVAQNTEYETVDELKQAIRTALLLQAKEAQIETVGSDLLEQLVASSVVTENDEEIDEQVRQEIDAYREEAAEAGEEYETYILETFGQTADRFEEELLQEVREDWTKQKVMQAFREAEQVDVGQDAYMTYLELRAEEFGYDDTEAFYEDIQLAGYEEQIHQEFLVRQVEVKLMELGKQVVTAQNQVALSSDGR